MTLSDTVIRGLQATIGPPLEGEARYVVRDEIGRGGMGVVYRAHDTALGRDVALKVVDRGALGEARTTAQLEHPGIVPVHDAGTLHDGRAFYAMKLVKGERLDAWLGTAPSSAERLSVFLRICEPVAFAHAQGIIHRDLKPGNIMVGSFGEVLVLDWGIACASGETRGSGTAGFSAPEPTATAAADVYSLGQILRAVVPELRPRAVSAICDKSAASNPADRYGSVLDLAADVQRFVNGERVLADRENIVRRLRRIVGRHKALLALLTAYLLMRTALVLFSAAR